MDFKEFAYKILKELREKADGNFNIWIMNSVDDNGNDTYALILNDRDKNNFNICLYNYYNDFCTLKSDMSNIIDEIYNRILKENNEYTIRINDILKWESVKDYIYAEFIKNETTSLFKLDIIPHRFINGKMLTYFICANKNYKCSLNAIAITNLFLQLWGVDEKDLYREYLRNSLK